MINKEHIFRFSAAISTSKMLYTYKNLAPRALKKAITEKKIVIFGSSKMLYPNRHMGEFPGAWAHVVQRPSRLADRDGLDSFLA